MKFGDKLIELRKKNGYSQEELAEKLGVSRQSVSKWESNNTYPETDKIIQIANLFECSMDDLINDKITDIDSTLRKNKSNINTVWNSLLSFITRTVNMFTKMKFMDGLKCVIEMIIIGFILVLLGHILCNSISSIFANIFVFIKPETRSIIREIIKSILYMVWFIISIIVMVYSFKIRYLNQYDDTEIKNEKENINSKEKDPSKKEIESDTNNKIIIHNEKDFEFLGSLSKLVILFIKFIAFWILIGSVLSALGFIIASVISIYLIGTNNIFLWILLLLIACSIVSLQISIILINFIFNKKINVLLNSIIFISCIVLAGVSIGLIALSFKNMEYIDDSSIFQLETKELELEYKDNLVIESNGLGLSNQYIYKIDNSIEENQIIVSRQIDPRYFQLETRNESMDQMPIIRVNQNEIENMKVYFDLFMKKLKENKVITFSNYGNDPLIIKANQTTINNLIENLKKLYLVEETNNGNEIIISTVLDKVYFKNGLEGEYNAINDTIHYEEDGYTCAKNIEVTEYGERIIYTCDYIEEE